MQGQHYQVNGSKFYGYYQALKCSKETGLFAEFIIPRWHIDAHLSVDVPSALSKGLEYWIDKKIDWLFDSFSQPKLQYTGGTDSHTILSRAYDKGHQFYSTWTQIGSITNEWFDRCDEEYAPALAWLEAYPDAVKHTQINRPTIEIYEQVWQNQVHPAYWLPGWHFCFKPVHRYLYHHQMIDYDCVVSGHFKPHMFKENGHWYWWMHNSHDEYTFFKNDISFFGDGYIPEVAVAQAYRAKQFFEEHLPEKNGSCTLGTIPYELRPSYHNYLGRLPALSEKIAIGTILAKSTHLSVKNQQCMEEMIALGRVDICKSWDEKRQEMIDDIRDVPYGITVTKGRSPIDNYASEIECMERVQRLAVVYRLDDDRLVEVDPVNREPL